MAAGQERSARTPVACRSQAPRAGVRGRPSSPFPKTAIAREISHSLYAGMQMAPESNISRKRGGLGRRHAQRYLAVHSLGCSRRPLRPVGPAGTSSLSPVANDVQASPGGDLHSPSQAEHMSGHGLAERNVRTRRPAAVYASTAPLQSGVTAARAAGAPSRSAAAAHALPPETRALDVTYAVEVYSV